MSSSKELEWVSREDYCEAGNIPRALHCAHTVAERMEEGWVDPLFSREEVELALEVLCDAPGGNPKLARSALKAVEHRFRRPELLDSDDNWVANATRYACGATMLAEVLHRNECYPEAILYTSSALDKLEAAAGSREALLKEVASSKPNSLAQAAVAVYAIRVAALRRAPKLAAHMDLMRARTEGIVPAYLASGCTYPRTSAFSIQTFFDQVERQEEKDLDLLYTVARETRGSTKRSWTTQPLVEMEHRRANGDVAGAKRFAKVAAERILDFGLFRHRATIDRYGYLSFD